MSFINLLIFFLLFVRELEIECPSNYLIQYFVNYELYVEIEKMKN